MKGNEVQHYNCVCIDLGANIVIKAYIIRRFYQWNKFTVGESVKYSKDCYNQIEQIGPKINHNTKQFTDLTQIKFIWLTITIKNSKKKS